MNTIPIIDLFAGPGGLGEGFSTLSYDDGSPVFQIKLSIEKDMHAHSTLLLRAFYRQFQENNTPEEYYKYLRSEICRSILFSKFPIEAERANEEAWLEELRTDNNIVIDSRIKKALSGATNWVLIGGPPCQAYSMVGRSRMRVKDEDKFQKDPRHFLYKEYLRILAIHQPTIFVMENVKGLLSAKINNDSTFNLIIKDLQKPFDELNNLTKKPLEYYLFSITQKNRSSRNNISPADFIVKTERYGIPQARHRIIILGIRSDMYICDPDVLQYKQQNHVQDVLEDLPKLRSGLSKEPDSTDNWFSVLRSIENASWIDDLDKKLKSQILSELGLLSKDLPRGNSFIKNINKPIHLSEWFFDDKLGGVCNHESRSHIRKDLHRYFFASVFAKCHGKSPLLKDYPQELLPSHKNIREAINGEKFGDRFRVQIRNKPSTTVVSHISKDGHYYIHYDPIQCRSLTVREAARLQTFPDNYYFEGPRTEQYHQVGNAVPPLLAKYIAEIVSRLLSKMNLD